MIFLLKASTTTLRHHFDAGFLNLKIDTKTLHLTIDSCKVFVYNSVKTK